MFCSSHTEACIDIFAQCDKYSEVKLTLAAKAYSSSDVGILDQVLTRLSLYSRILISQTCKEMKVGSRNWEFKKLKVTSNGAKLLRYIFIMAIMHFFV